MRNLTLAGGRLWLLLLAALLVWPMRGWSASRVLYQTGFEAPEFRDDLTLVGQGGWVGWGSGGNGLVTNYFSGGGLQQAFVGFAAPTNNGDFLNVWRPLNYRPGGTNPPVVRFTVRFSIEDSSTTNRDDFRWSVYNLEEHRLFTLDFENETLGINYLLDQAKPEFVSTGRTFTNSVVYRLEILMHFGANRWSATLDGTSLVTDQPITTNNAALNLGDIDAVWAIRRPGQPGDNYLVFDDYQVLVEDEALPAPPRLEGRRQVKPEDFLVRCYGQVGARYVLEATADFRGWIPLKTNTVPEDGYFDHFDEGGGARRYYRAVQR